MSVLSVPSGDRSRSGARPAAIHDRWMAVDSVRGLALLGVIIMNIGAMAMRFNGQEIASDAGPVGLTLMGLDLVLVQGKARACFALLFGFGIASLMARTPENRNACAAHVRRMAALFAIGLFNQVFLFWGDILAVYALLGVLAGAAVAWPKPRLLAAGLTLTLLPPVLLGLAETIAGEPFPSLFSFDEGAQAARGLAAMTGTVYGDAVLFNATQAIERRIADPLGMAVYDLGLLGLMLIGVWLARQGILADVAAHRRLLRRVAVWCLPIGFALSVVSATRLGGVPAEGWRHGVVTAAHVAFPVLAFGYIAGFSLLFERRQGLLQRYILAPAGQMTLTNYLASGAIGGWVFYGYGLAQISEVNLTMLALGPVGLFLALALASHFWLRRFRRGPAEWLWRFASGSL